MFCCEYVRTMTSCHVVPSKYEVHDFVWIRVLSESIIPFSTSQSDNEPERASNSCYGVPSSPPVVSVVSLMLHPSNSLCPKIWLKKGFEFIKRMRSGSISFLISECTCLHQVLPRCNVDNGSLPKIVQTTLHINPRTLTKKSLTDASTVVCLGLSTL